MREIKFRAWNSYNKKMTFDGAIGFNGQEVTAGTDGCGDDECCGSYGVLDYSDWDKYTTVMQYTGLKDKNGKEIFEGDIVNVPYNGMGNRVVRFEAGKFSVCDFKISELIVIGNIYEDLELLKDTK